MEEKKERSAAAIYARAFFEKEKLSFSDEIDLAAFMQQAFQNVKNGTCTTLDQDLGYDAEIAIIDALISGKDLHHALDTLIRHAITLGYERIFAGDADFHNEFYELPNDLLFFARLDLQKAEAKIAELEEKIANDEKDAKIAELEKQLDVMRWTLDRKDMQLGHLRAAWRNEHAEKEDHLLQKESLKKQLAEKEKERLALKKQLAARKA